MTDKLDSAKAPSKGAWTPGPWKVMSPDYVAGVPIYFLDDINFCTVSRVDGTNAIANATLISKAPDLYEALADLIEAAGNKKLPLWLVGRLHAAKCLLTELEGKL